MKTRRFILNFHGIGKPNSHVPSDEIPYWVGEETFREIVDFAASAPGKRLLPIELTFDDGNESDFKCGLPALMEKGVSARFFVLAGRIGAKDYLSRGQIRELGEVGMIVGNHGWSHIDWRGATAQELRRELLDARCFIEDIIGKGVSEAAIPFGGYNRSVVHALMKFGYTAIFSSDGGIAGVPLPIPRNTVTRGHDIGMINRLVENEQKLHMMAMRRVKAAIKKLL